MKTLMLVIGILFAVNTFALPQEHANCLAGEEGCGPTGAHEVHKAAGYNCSVCHRYAGTLTFSKVGGAYLPAPAAAPTYDATTATCSSVACHALPASSFTYGRWVYDDGYEQGGYIEYITVNTPATRPGTPNWYADVGDCAGCHTIPANNNYWHTGHAQLPQHRECQTCHNGVTSTDGGTKNLVLTDASLHRNGTVDVAPKWANPCMNCH